jgi:uncharacterized membrane protein HdeD (DUF308 family)
MVQPKKGKPGPRRPDQRRPDRRREEKIFDRRNWLILAAGLIVIIIGFIALAAGSITLAPILLVLGYCVLIPVGIMIGKQKKGETQGG